MITLRPAAEADQARISAIVRAARINPMDLKWQNFIVAEDAATGEIIGTGQVKSHRDGSRELASIAVVPEYQRRGIGRQIVERLLTNEDGVIFLTCRSDMGSYYEPFGFRAIDDDELTPYFRRLKKVAGVFELLASEGVTLLVMKRGG